MFRTSENSEGGCVAASETYFCESFHGSAPGEKKESRGGRSAFGGLQLCTAPFVRTLHLAPGNSLALLLQHSSHHALQQPELLLLQRQHQQLEKLKLHLQQQQEAVQLRLSQCLPHGCQQQLEPRQPRKRAMEAREEEDSLHPSQQHILQQQAHPDPPPFEAICHTQKHKACCTDARFAGDSASSGGQEKALADATSTAATSAAPAFIRGTSGFACSDEEKAALCTQEASQQTQEDGEHSSPQMQREQQQVDLEFCLQQCPLLSRMRGCETIELSRLTIRGYDDGSFRHRRQWLLVQQQKLLQQEEDEDGKEETTTRQQSSDDQCLAAGGLPVAWISTRFWIPAEALCWLMQRCSNKLQKLALDVSLRRGFGVSAFAQLHLNARMLTLKEMQLVNLTRDNFRCEPECHFPSLETLKLHWADVCPQQHKLWCLLRGCPLLRSLSVHADCDDDEVTISTTRLFAAALLQLLQQQQQQGTQVTEREAPAGALNHDASAAAAAAAAAEAAEERGFCPLPLLEELQLPLLSESTVPLLRAASPNLRVLRLVHADSHRTHRGLLPLQLAARQLRQLQQIVFFTPVDFFPGGVLPREGRVAALDTESAGEHGSTSAAPPATAAGGIASEDAEHVALLEALRGLLEEADRLICCQFPSNSSAAAVREKQHQLTDRYHALKRQFKSLQVSGHLTGPSAEVFDVLGDPKLLWRQSLPDECSCAAFGENGRLDPLPLAIGLRCGGLLLLGGSDGAAAADTSQVGR
ncbi:hypothetical protein cyc_00273 [Cyclospora cayetanensis]|uniref:Uncharacterized protein n=1 Tax=Cyclospora cayetanensis TaxID=88456 RepID=A0A1D3CTB5_9EIME|nr:hypothetical protein cyc_00273 [Cyclospora cayetanensis]